MKVNDGTTALHLLAAEAYDAVFLDLELPGMDGISLLKALPRQTSVVVISASADFAADSYGFDVVDYLVKPLEFSRFAKAVGKLEKAQSLGAVTGSARPPDALFLREGSTIQRVDLAELAYVEAQSNYASFVFDSGDALMSLVSLRKLEGMLPSMFIRIHRSFIVNATRIRNIEGSKIRLKSGSLPIGQSYRECLLAKLKVIN